MTKKQEKLQAQLNAALEENKRLNQEAHQRNHDIDELRVRLSNEQSDNRALKHELMSMQSSNEHATAVHRDVITILLDHHNYKPRDIEWVDEKGRCIGVQVSQTAKNHIFGLADAEQKVAYHDR